MIGQEPIIGSKVDAGPSQLIVTIAGQTPQTHTLTNQSLTLGRQEGNDIVIPSQLVSRNHARLEKTSGGYKLTMSSEAKNPILFEGRELEGSRVLRHGDIFRIGSLDPGMMVTMTYNAPSEALLSGWLVCGVVPWTVLSVVTRGSAGLPLLPLSMFAAVVAGLLVPILGATGTTGLWFSFVAALLVPGALLAIRRFALAAPQPASSDVPSHAPRSVE